MSSVYYFDTSAVVKLYHQELGTDQVEALFAQMNSAIMISELTLVELNSTVAALRFQTDAKYAAPCQRR